MSNFRSLNSVNMTDSFTGHECVNDIIIGIEYGLIALGVVTAFAAIVSGVCALNAQCCFQPIIPDDLN